MEAYFNELSMLNEKAGNKNIHEFASHLVEVYRFVHQAGIRTCRIGGSDLTKLVGLFQDKSYRDVVNLIFAFFRQPYEGEELSRHEDEYLLHEYTYRKLKCAGLAYAYLLHTFTVSLHLDPWIAFHIPLTIDNDSGENVPNVAGTEAESDFLQWIEQARPVELTPSKIEPSMKPIHLRDDHGEDILQEFADKIVQSEYVESVINSIPFHPRQRVFIYGIHPDGKIEIVLPWTDEGYGLVVQTTGRNFRETEEIARILKEKFGRR